MDDFTKLENIEKYFKEINCYGITNCYFTAQTDQSIIPYLFGAVGGIATAIHGVKTKKVMGYLVNQFDNDICLIPIVVDTLNKNKVDTERFLLLKQEDIEKIIIKNEDFIFKKIKIVMKDKQKFIMKATKKIKNTPYHEENLNRFIEKCSKGEKYGV